MAADGGPGPGTLVLARTAGVLDLRVPKPDPVGAAAHLGLHRVLWCRLDPGVGHRMGRGATGLEEKMPGPLHRHDLHPACRRTGADELWQSTSDAPSCSELA